MFPVGVRSSEKQVRTDRKYILLFSVNGAAIGKLQFSCHPSPDNIIITYRQEIIAVTKP
jgi:hypothetical protein